MGTRSATACSNAHTKWPDSDVLPQGKFNATLMGKYKDKMKATKDACNKTKGEKYCFKEETCVGRGLPCAPQQECPDDKPFRCGRSWKCQENATMCDNDAARPEPCPTGQQRCPGTTIFALLR